VRRDCPEEYSLNNVKAYSLNGFYDWIFIAFIDFYASSTGIIFGSDARLMVTLHLSRQQLFPSCLFFIFGKPEDQKSRSLRNSIDNKITDCP